MLADKSASCATCGNALAKRGVRVLAPEQMRVLAANGFGEAVPLLKEHQATERKALFRDFAASYSTPWRICRECTERAAAYGSEDLAGPVQGSPQVGRSAIQKTMRPLAYPIVRKIAGALLALAALIAWTNADAVYTEAIWWWQSRAVISEAKEKSRAGDWSGARELIQQALTQYPDNPRLIEKAAIVQMIDDRAYLAGMYFRALVSIEAIPYQSRMEAEARADSIARATRERARRIVEDASRLYDSLPFAMQEADGANFDAYEAISIPPIKVEANLSPSVVLDSLDGTQVLCMGIAGGCGWSFPTVPWVEVLRTRTIRIDFPAREGKPPCCEISLDDPELNDPAAAIRQISFQSPGHQVRALYGLAAKLAFLANVTAFNGPRLVPF